MNSRKDFHDSFSYQFSFWFLVASFIMIFIGFAIPDLYFLSYIGIGLLIVFMLIKFLKNAIELDR
ncbi:Uncharacterised protein [uncultured archaeon]|nr:Uncharacterised protein [uncultured archaeon]